MSLNPVTNSVLINSYIKANTYTPIMAPSPISIDLESNSEDEYYVSSAQATSSRLLPQIEPPLPLQANESKVSGHAIKGVFNITTFGRIDKYASNLTQTSLTPELVEAFVIKNDPITGDDSRP